MISPFTYKVEWFYGGNVEKSTGVLFANSYKEAAEMIEENYDDTLVSMRLFGLEESNYLNLPESVVDSLENGD